MQISKEVKIGAISIGIFAISVWGFSFLKGKNLFESTNEYYVIFERVDGLIESGNVVFQGYKIGSISALEFEPDHKEKFRVKVAIDKKLKIPLNSIIKINKVNPLASTSDLEISFSNAKTYHQAGDTLLSGSSKGMADYVSEYQAKFDNILAGLDSTLQATSRILDEEGQKNLQESLNSLNIAFKSLEKSLGPNGSLTQSLDNFESITSNLAGKNEEISSSIDHLSKVTASLDSADIGKTITKLDTTLLTLNKMMSKMNEGEGSMGKLLNDSSLYRNLDSTSYYLSILMKDMQENPKRYVHFSLFGKKDTE